MTLADLIRDQASQRSRFTTLTLLVALFALPCASQDFDWSWENNKDGAAPKTESTAEKPTEAVNKDGEFKWSWDGGAAQATNGKPEQGTPPPASGPTARIRDDEAYQKLLQENLTLRREIADAMKDEQVARKENQRLGAEIKDMENDLAQSIRMLKGLKASKDAAVSPDTVNELEVRLAEAEKAKEELALELDRLKSVRDSEAVETKSLTAGIAKDSDLFQERERENVLLRKRFGEIESERRKLADEAINAKTEAEQAKTEAEKAREALAEVSEKAMAAARQGAQYKKIVEQLPAIEEQVANLKTDVAMKDEKIVAREQQLAALTVELERREYRLAKAQKMADLLTKTRAEVLQSNNREKLDMHYNMAVIYAKEGRVNDAEAEYLRALRIDPSDADIHYNLGILYDQDLKEPKKAVMHYRRYLSIRANAADADQVKSWIIDLEMRN